jgi:DNA-binding response OmpR family regulator
VTPDAWRPCILVVDDEPYVPRVLELKFSRAGWRTVVARNGLEGLAAIERERPDVVITDISMPEMSGDQLCREAQRHRAVNPFLLIVVTSRTDRELRVWMDDIPELLFFEKPVSPKAVMTAVEHYLAGRRAHAGTGGAS